MGQVRWVGWVKQVHGRLLFPKDCEFMRECKLKAVGMQVEEEESGILRFHAWPRPGKKD
jgi:hypothetical protein